EEQERKVGGAPTDHARHDPHVGARFHVPHTPVHPAEVSPGEHQHQADQAGGGQQRRQAPAAGPAVQRSGCARLERSGRRSRRSHALSYNPSVIVDPHHHLWQRARGDYHWLDSRANPALAPIDRDYLLHDYQALTAAHTVGGSVAVQAAESVAETRWLLEQARAAGGLILGVVGWTDMAAASAPKV